TRGQKRTARRTRPGSLVATPSPNGKIACRWSRSSSPLGSCVGLLQLQRTGTLGPVARAVLHQFLQLDFAFADPGHDAEILSDVVAGANLIDVTVRCPHERVNGLVALERADHRQRLERIRLEWLLAAREIGRKLARPLRGLDLPGLERVRQVECVVCE